MHNDDFRLLTAGDGSAAMELVRVAPGVSPVFGSNPGYQVYTYDTQTFALQNETTSILDLASSTPTWSNEYNYAETYGQTLATPQEWLTTYAGILTNPVFQTAYLTYKNQDAVGQSTITAANAPVYLLAPFFVTPVTYNAAATALAG